MSLLMKRKQHIATSTTNTASDTKVVLSLVDRQDGHVTLKTSRVAKRNKTKQLAATSKLKPLIVVSIRDLTLHVDQMLYGFIMDYPTVLVKAFTAFTAQLPTVTKLAESGDSGNTIDISAFEDIINIDNHCVDVGQGSKSSDDQTYIVLIDDLYEALNDLRANHSAVECCDVHSAPVIDTTQITTVAAAKSALCQLIVFFTGRYQTADHVHAICTIDEFQRVWKDVCYLWKDQQITYKDEDDDSITLPPCSPSLDRTLAHIADICDVEGKHIYQLDQTADAHVSIYSLIQEIDRLGDGDGRDGDGDVEYRRRCHTIQLKLRRMVRNIFCIGKLRVQESLYYKHRDMQRAIEELENQIGANKSSDADADEWKQFYETLLKKRTTTENETMDLAQLNKLILGANQRIDAKYNVDE
jgi:hypothetical protein